MEFKNLFKGLKIKDFDSVFATEESCLKFLADEKWKEGYVCKKCGHANYCSGRSLYSRRCTRCKYEESAKANTVFHRCKVSLPVAFSISYSVCNDPKISTYQLSDKYDLRQMTCWRFKKKIMQCVDDNKTNNV
ncbi:MAG: transposase [Bacteroidota bacterium]|nr:transposase [Bacteroidota bacterium]